MSRDDMDNFEQKEIKKIRPIKNNWYDWLINYIPEHIRENVGGFKDKIVSLFKTNTPKQTVYGSGKKLSKPKTTTKKQSEENIINSITSLFIQNKENKEIKDRIIRDIRTLFEQEDKEDYYKPKRVSNFWNNNYNGDSNK